MKRALARAWYNNAAWVKLLWPLSGLYWLLATAHKALVLRQPRYQANVPVIIVGNVTAGSTG